MNYDNNENIEEIIDNQEENAEEVNNEEANIDEIDSIAEEITDIILETKEALESQEESEETPTQEHVTVEVSEPENMEAIVEGLLYIVGDDGVKASQIASVINKSLEDTKVILSNIQRKYASEVFGIELVDYGENYKFISKKSVYPYAQE